jgi:hypothetical protein
MDWRKRRLISLDSIRIAFQSPTQPGPRPFYRCGPDPAQEGRPSTWVGGAADALSGVVYYTEKLDVLTAAGFRLFVSSKDRQGQLFSCACQAGEEMVLGRGYQQYISPRDPDEPFLQPCFDLQILNVYRQLQ